MAGSRFGEMAPKIPFSYDTFIKETTKAMNSSVKGDLTMISEEDNFRVNGIKSKRPFTETMAGAGQLWAQFPKTPEWNEKKMNIIQEYFGQQIKLSIATEAQQDLVESVIEDLKHLTFVDVMKVFLCYVSNQKTNEEENESEATQKDIDSFF